MTAREQLLERLMREFPVREGGYFSPEHQGRPGMVGGSLPAGAGGGDVMVIEHGACTSRAETRMIKEIGKWPVDEPKDPNNSTEIAYMAVSDVRSGVTAFMLRDDNGLSCICTWEDLSSTDTPNQVALNYLAVRPDMKGRGYGTLMLAKVCGEAANLGKGVGLFPCNAAIPFYKKCGMQFNVQKNRMTFTPEQARDFAHRRLK